MIDDDLENSGLRELIEKGREQGYITFADINDYLPDEVSDPDQLDEVIQIINDLGLQVLEEAPEEGSNFSPANQDTPETPTENEMGTIESEVGRTTDPVRLYMREMGSVDLLTREGEIAIAKRIEEGARDLLHACAFYPGIIEDVLLEYELIKKEDKRITDLVVGFMDEEEDLPPSTEEVFDPKQMMKKKMWVLIWKNLLKDFLLSKDNTTSHRKPLLLLEEITIKLKKILIN